MSIRNLGVSISFIVCVCVTSHITRNFTNKIFNNGPIRILIQEGIAAAELCASGFELGIVAEHYGLSTYGVCLFLLSIWWNQTWTNVSACPYIHMEQFVEGYLSLRELFLKIWAELMGGCCVYRIVQIYWYLELGDIHKGKAFGDCTADLKVGLYTGAAIEGISTFLCRITTKMLSEKNARYANIIDCFIATCLVVAAASYSGGYFNPLLATALKWGCTGHTKMEHIIVYWIGASLGSLLSVMVYQKKFIQHFLLRFKVD